MEFPKSLENRVASWILAAIAHSALMAGFVFLISLSAGRPPRVSALVLVWGEFSVGNIFLYVLLARSLRAWKAKQATSRGVWVVGSLVGGGNLALAFHLLASGGVLPCKSRFCCLYRQSL
jgi:hypothetical protein